MRTRTTPAIAAALAVGVLLVWMVTSTTGQEKQAEPGAKSEPALTPAQFAERTLHRRAVEAVIWGMPAVNYDLMLQQMLT